MEIWLATNPHSRKVKEIRNNRQVVLYYSAPQIGGYVTITGTARLVDDISEKANRWKEAWAAFYPDRDKNYLLIAVTPQKLEIISDAHGIIGNPDNWQPPAVYFSEKR